MILGAFSLVSAHSFKSTIILRILYLGIILMKKQITLLLLGMVLSTGLYAANLKVGVVSMKQLSAEAPQAKLINERLQGLIKEPKEELDKLASELEGLGKKIEKDKLMSSPSQVQKMKEEYQKKVITFKQKEAALNRGVQSAQQRASAVFGEAVMRVVNKIAKDEKYDLVVHEGVLYVNEKLNITDKVLNVLKKDFKKQEAESKKAAKEEKSK
jgi:outer membrane protein